MSLDVFPKRLTEQRKMAGLSQKQAAADLGISQALLSHYENGLREPGLSFLVRAADYYNVSCDYLLGHTANVLRLNQAPEFENTPEDLELTQETMVRAHYAILGNLVEDDEMHGYTLESLALSAYMILFAAVTKGLLPRSWLGDNSDNKSQLKFLMTSLAGDIHDLTSAPEGEDLLGTPPPAAVETLSSYVNDLINVRVAELL